MFRRPISPAARASDKSERFLSVLAAMCREKAISNITSVRCDLDAGDFPEILADRAWCRWVFAFVKDPRALRARIDRALAPNGVLVLHEYFDYSTWRAFPPCSELEEFVSAVMASWRGQGGDPDIALWLPLWLEERGFTLRRVRPIVTVAEPDQVPWKWMASFVEVGRRLVDLGYLPPQRADAIWQAFVRFQATSGARLITPGVMEIVAARR